MPKQTLKQATKRSIYLAKVDKLDKIGKDPAKFLQEESFSAVENVLGDMIIRVQENINKIPNFVNTGKITEMYTKAENGVVNLYGTPHLLFQDRGVSGTEKKYNSPHGFTDKMPPPSVFIPYIKSKNLKLRDNAKYYGEESPFKETTEAKDQEKLSWAIAKSIYKKGIKPKNVFSKEIKQTLKELKEIVPNVMIQSFNQIIAVKESAKRTIPKKK